MAKGNYPFLSSWVQNTKTLYRDISFENKDQSLKTIMEDWFFTEVITPGFGVLKRWNGASWVTANLKVYNGSWVKKPLKMWNGAEFKIINS